jgi:anti-sigma-K factor RskA
VNPQFHEEFVALSALFFSGELTDEEWALLQVHLAYCDACREAFEQYKRIHANVIPAMAASAAAEATDVPRESESALQEAELKLMNQLSASPDSKEFPARSVPWRLFSGVLAACAIVAALIYVFAGHHAGQPAVRLEASKTPSTPPSKQTAQPTPESALRDELDRTKREVADLQQQLTAAQNRPSSLLPSEAMKRQQQKEQASYEQLTTDKDSLARQLLAAQADLQSLGDKLASADANGTQQTAQMSALQARVRQLNESLAEKNTALDDKERMLALDKDFLSHDRDIRDLIGARNLYIADIFDTNENGKTAKPFGRLFYTKDRSLVFYGFDLEKQAGLTQPVAFQAWGSGSDTKPVNLGLFYQDDSHKRWVVRFSDPKTLARLNMVFVTVEPPGGSNRPTGKQLLRAYLQIQPNHP